MKDILIIVFLINGVYNCTGQTVVNDPHWELLWEDQFNDNSIDLNKWLILDYGYGNDVTIFMDDYVRESNGNLILKADKISTYCPVNPPTNWGSRGPCQEKVTYPYTCGYIESKEALNVRYGLIEARIKLPYGMGFWPAFWTFVGAGLPSHTNAAEIDIFEMLGHLPSSTITTNIHTCYTQGCEPNYYQECKIGSYAYTYHNYAIAWSPSKIVWFIDGSPIRISNNHGIIDPVRIIFSFAVDPGHLPNSSTPFPSEMYVDYIKVHQLKNDCNNSVLNCSFNFNSIDYRVKKNIKIGGAGCSNTVPSKKNVYLRATNSFRIEGNFTIPLGSTFYVDVNQCH